ncbi:SusC/RagA family TonB-linked outer membrane protein [Halosquirtibacter laminarini]|uniref:SusC/RagA family TonB-linked outer membrane protein n=1 Tax=Halosquirtibacter laminarini TaxID=3374600 RepID=A0AC61NQV4_9BACT|nr:SusC/RagA family TonB-linked outer membrane protein [Prolixibacteraceae bacterium]
MNRVLMLFVCILMCVQSSWAQSKVLKGVVTSAEDNSPIPGASVVVKGTTIGAVTDYDGKFQLKVPNDSKVLRISYVGMTEQELTIGSKTEFKVQLKSSQVDLDDVIVVAYGTAKKESFTGSATTVKSEEVLKTSGGITKALQGTVAGVQVVGGSVRIRGYGSFNASSGPLYVVDGVIGAPTPSDEDIASMTILKDASSTALYGSKGANGVILITTKTGSKLKKPQIQFSYKKSNIDPIDPDFDYMDAGQHYQYIHEGLYNYAKGYGKDDEFCTNYSNQKTNAKLGHNPYNMTYPIGADGKLDEKAQLLYSTNWRDAVLKPADLDEYIFSIRGNNGKTNYSWSNFYSKYKGFVEESKYDNFNSRFSFDTKVSPIVDMGLKINLSYYQGSGTYTDAANENNMYYMSNSITPTAPMYKMKKVKEKPDGTYEYAYDLDYNGNKQYNYDNPNYQGYNPVGLMELDESNDYYFSAYIAPFIRIKPAKGLTLNVNGSAKAYGSRSSSYTNNLHGSGVTNNGRSYRSDVFTRRYYAHSDFVYETDFAAVHHIEILAGAESYYYHKNTTGASIYGLPMGDVSNELSYGVDPQKPSSSTLESTSLSYLSRIRYSLMDKYYIDGSFRRDGSSKFGPNNRWGNFWSVGASWRISQEDFLKESDVIDNLKLRGSYGVTGNDGIGSYKYGDYYGFGYSYLSDLGIVHNNLPNYDLGWEKQDNLSLGIDYSLLHRISGTLEVYKRNTSSLLMDRPIPYTTGFSSVTKNVGEIENRGIEFEINALAVKTKHFQWNTVLTFTKNINEIVEIPESWVSGTKKYVQGKSRYEYFIRDWAGVNPDNGKPQWYMDQKDPKTGAVSKVKTSDYGSATKYFVGQSTPDFFGGFNNDFKFYGFDLSCQIIYSVGGNVYDYAYAHLMHDGSSKTGVSAVEAMNSWKKKGDITDIPQNIWDNKSHSSSTSTRFLVDGDFLKVKNVTLGYTIPSRITKKVGVSNLRFYVNADNLFILTDMKSGDPEISLSGNGSSYTLPMYRTVRFGVNINF